MSGKTSSASINKYMDKAYDRINFTVYKGEKAEIAAAAEKVGQSVNAYIREAVRTRMESEK